MATKTLHAGVCAGGPLDGVEVAVRFPAGFLLVDKTAVRCWIYDRTSGRFQVRDPDGEPLLDDGPKNRFRAADESEYDVLARP